MILFFFTVLFAVNAMGQTIKISNLSPVYYKKTGTPAVNIAIKKISDSKARIEIEVRDSRKGDESPILEKKIMSFEKGSESNQYQIDWSKFPGVDSFSVKIVGAEAGFGGIIPPRKIAGKESKDWTMRAKTSFGKSLFSGVRKPAPVATPHTNLNDIESSGDNSPANPEPANEKQQDLESAWGKDPVQTPDVPKITQPETVMDCDLKNFSIDSLVEGKFLGSIMRSVYFTGGKNVEATWSIKRTKDGEMLKELSSFWESWETSPAGNQVFVREPGEYLITFRIRKKSCEKEKEILIFLEIPEPSAPTTPAPKKQDKAPDGSNTATGTPTTYDESSDVGRPTTLTGKWYTNPNVFESFGSPVFITFVEGRDSGFQKIDGIIANAPNKLPRNQKWQARIWIRHFTDTLVEGSIPFPTFVVTDTTVDWVSFMFYKGNLGSSYRDLPWAEQIVYVRSYSLDGNYEFWSKARWGEVGEYRLVKKGEAFPKKKVEPALSTPVTELPDSTATAVRTTIDSLPEATNEEIAILEGMVDTMLLSSWATPLGYDLLAKGQQVKYEKKTLYYTHGAIEVSFVAPANEKYILRWVTEDTDGKWYQIHEGTSIPGEILQKIPGHSPYFVFELQSKKKGKKWTPSTWIGYQIVKTNPAPDDFKIDGDRLIERTKNLSKSKLERRH